MNLRGGLQISGAAQGIHSQLGTTGIHSPLAETCLHRATGPMPESGQKSCECIRLIEKHQRNELRVYTHNSQPSRKMSEVYRASGL